MESRVILFVCKGNTCRSVLAEHLARQLYPVDLFNCAFRSAGTEPGKTSNEARAADVLREEYGIDASGHVQHLVNANDIERAYRVITLDDEVFRDLVDRAKGKILLWPLIDPKDGPGGDHSLYSKCARIILERLRAPSFEALLK